MLVAFGLDEKVGIRFSPKKNEKVEFVSGGFMMIKKKVFNELMGFDENYFMYIEDMDLCYRAHKKGYGVHFLPYGSIIHQGQGSSSRAFAIEHIFKGLTIFYNKNKKGELSYLRFLLRFKAALIIFMGTILRDYQLVAGYRKAVRKIT